MEISPKAGQIRTGVSRSLFRLADFRVLSANMLLASVGMMGEIVVLGWLALELTDSPFLVGLAMGARALPLFFVGVPAGVLADRWPRHHLLIATGVGQALTAATLGALVLFGVLGLPLLLLLTLAAGTLRGVEHAARQSYTHDVVGPQRLVPGLAVLGVAMRAGWLVGSLGAGALIAALGSGPAYLTVAAAYMAGAAALVRGSAPRGALPPGRESVWQNIVGFVTLVRRDRTLLALMTLTAGGEVLGFSHQTLLPSLARDVLHSGPEGLGVLNAARAVGGILGLFVSMRGAIAGGGTLFLAVLGGFGLSIVALGLAPYLVGFWGVVLILVIVNAVGALADLLAQSLLQLGSAPQHRGRAGGAWVVAPIDAGTTKLRVDLHVYRSTYRAAIRNPRCLDAPKDGIELVLPHSKAEMVDGKRVVRLYEVESQALIDKDGGERPRSGLSP